MMFKRTLFAFLAVAVILATVLPGCEPRRSRVEFIGSNSTPPGADNVNSLGNRWFTFDWNGRKFLMRDNGHPLLVELNKDE